MNAHQVDVLVALGVGAFVGAALMSRKRVQEYNELVRKYNLLSERDAIKGRVFKEILPHLPDDYTLSEATMTDIKSWTMFAENDL